MVDYGERNFNTDFSGLVTTVIIMGVVGGVCLGGFETLRQMKRLPNRHFLRWWRKDPLQRHGRRGIGTNKTGIGDPPQIKTTQEDWEMGHLYHARTFHATTPSPPLARWPLGWAWQSLRLDDWFYATHCGMDNVVYVRFLRGCVWWLLLQCLTTAPILLSIHFTFSKGVPLEDMSRASLAYLVTVPDDACPDPHASECQRHPNVQGRKLLWIHLCILWYITATWFYTLWWIGKGSIKVRRRLLDKVDIDRAAAVQALMDKKAKEQEALALEDERVGQPMRAAQGIPDTADGDSSEGWRQRTVLVTNLPISMRDEASLRRYFEEFLRPDDASVTDIDPSDDGATDVPSRSEGSRVGSSEEDDTLLTKHAKVNGKSSNVEHRQQTADSYNESHLDSQWHSGEATAGTVGKKGGPPNHLTFDLPHGPAPDIMPRRNLRSPIQTVIVVRKMNELSAMLTRRQEILQQLEEAHVKLAQNVLAKVGRKQEKNQRLFERMQQRRRTGTQNAPQSDARNRSHTDVEDAAATTQVHGTPLDILTKHLARFVDESGEPSRPKIDVDSGDIKAGEGEPGAEDTSHLETVWEVLAVLPRQLLDPYQPVTSLSALFRGQKVPSIDYLLTKLNLLTALIAEMKARPPTEYEATSSAFVTFRDPRQARMVWRELKTQIVMRVRMAPEVKDLDWDRIMRTSFTGDLVRGAGVNAFFWAFTVFWVIPVQIITTALFSVEHLKEVVPGLARFLNAHQRLEGFISVTLPTVLVSLITMSVPELVFQISKRAQGFVTWSSLYDQCLCRYWKFVVCNIVIFFCIGTTTLEAILQQIGNPGQEQVLDNIAFAFPTAAPFFVSYLILGLALHTGFELLGFMIPILQHFLSANKATTPRARALRTLPRNFNRYYWLPFHILIMTIVFIFAILNPLVIPFALIYMFFAMIVFKKNFAFTYYRRFMEKEGAVYFVRLFRFTLDGLVTGQVVILIFFCVTDQERAYIGLTALLLPLTIAFKWLGTRLWKSQCRAIEDEEANVICGISASSETMLPSGQKDYGNELGHGESAEVRAPLDARASGRFPAVLPAPTNRSRLVRVWQLLHDSFNANGADRPSYIARRSAQGKPVDHAVRTGAKLALRAPRRVADKAKKDTHNIRQVAKMSFGVNKVMKMEAEQEAIKAMQSKDVDSATVQRRASKGVRAYNGLDGGLNRQPTSRSHGSALRVASPSGTHRRVSQRSQYKDGEGMPRSNSTRSMRGNPSVDEKPFLSGFEAVANHAPVASDDGLSAYDEFADGEDSFAHAYTLPRSRSVRLVSGERPQHNRFASFTESGQTVLAQDGPADRMAPAPYSTSIVRQAPGGLSSLTVPENERDLWQDSEQKQMDRTESPVNLEDDDDEEEDEDALSAGSDGPLVRPHAKIKWDDTPNNQARYNNPFYACELDPFLWLPRDPLAPLNLCDTIEWHGAALVSSDGGHGRVGEWEEDDMDEDEEDFDEFGNFIGDDSTSRRSRVGEIEGHEEIMINSELARRLEEEEDVHQVTDPAASLPKNVMDEYRDAIRMGSEGEHEGDAAEASGFEGSHQLERHSSALSATSLRSPAPSVRRELDLEFGRQSGALPTSQSQDADLTMGSVGGASAAPALPPGILNHQGTLGVGTTLRRDASMSSAMAGPTGTLGPADPRRTHFAPDPAHPDASSPAANRQRLGTMTGRSHSQRRAQDVSIVSSGGASIRSTSTYGKTVTMRQALQAEVLEEERRRTIRDRLAAKGRKASRSRSVKRSKSTKSNGRDGEHGDEESRAGHTQASETAEDEEAAAEQEGHMRHTSEILARHQRALSRRRRAEDREREQNQMHAAVDGPTSPRLVTPTSPTTASRLGTWGRSMRRGSTLRRSSVVASELEGQDQSRQTSSQLLRTPQRRPRVGREASAASTVILHDSPHPAMGMTPSSSGRFPTSSATTVENTPQRARGAGGVASSAGASGTTPHAAPLAESMEMTELKGGTSGSAADSSAQQQ